MPVVLLPFPPLTARTATQLIRDALGLTNSVGVDQTLTADETTDCLRVLNDLLEDWSTQSLAIFGLGTQTFNTVSGTATYTVGVGGNWNTNRPVRINGSAYSTISGATFPCAPMMQAEYDSIPVKAQTQAYPDSYLYVNVNTATPLAGLCVSRYDVTIYSQTVGKLSHTASAVPLQVELLHRGGLAGGTLAAHVEGVTKGVLDTTEQFATQVRNANTPVP